MNFASVFPALKRLARILTRSRAEADDLVQKTCERAVSRAEQWRGETRLESWLFRIMRGIWVDEIRARAVRGRRLTSLATELEHDVVDGERLTEARLQLHAVAAELEQMPEMDRVLLLLVCVDGASYREAAEALGVPIGTVMSRLSRARTELWTRLEGTRSARRPARARQPAATSALGRPELNQAKPMPC